jgi:hypothetical protein
VIVLSIISPFSQNMVMNKNLYIYTKRRNLPENIEELGDVSK